MAAYLCHEASAFSPPATLVADFLHVHSSSSAQGLATGYLRALTWVAKHAGFPELWATLQMPLTKAYGLASNPTPRREAPALPLSFVVFLEKSIINTVGSVADRLAMGGFWLMTWGSLRWSDVQWVAPTDLTDDATTL